VVLEQHDSVSDGCEHPLPVEHNRNSHRTTANRGCDKKIDNLRHSRKRTNGSHQLDIPATHSSNDKKEEEDAAPN